MDVYTADGMKLGTGGILVAGFPTPDEEMGTVFPRFVSGTMAADPAIAAGNTASATPIIAMTARDTKRTTPPLWGATKVSERSKGEFLARGCRYCGRVLLALM